MDVAARTLGFLIVRRVLGLVGLGPDADAKDVEIAVLRHQLVVLRRQVARPRYTPADRMLLATMARLLPRERWPLFLVTPSTLLRWHRELIRRRWTYPQASQHDRRSLPEDVVQLVVRLARENCRWGYLRIVGGMPQTRRRRIGHIGPHDPARTPARPGAQKWRPELGGVLALPSRRNNRV